MVIVLLIHTTHTRTAPVGQRLPGHRREDHALLPQQMMRSHAHVVNIASIAGRRMRISSRIDRPHPRLHPAMRLRVGVRIRDHPPALPAVEAAGRGEKRLRIGGGYLKGSVADAQGLGFDEDKQQRGPAEFGVAAVEK